MATNKEKAEFRGLFLGEGYCGICKYHAKYKHFHKRKGLWIEKNRIWYRPQMSLSQRDDNAEMIYWMQGTFGGHIYIARNKRYDGKNCRRSIIWITTNHELSEQLCKILLKSSIPSKKLESVRIVLKYLKMRYRKDDGRRYFGYTDEQNQIFEKLYLACKNNHKYQG